MSNTNAPNGFVEFRRLSGGAPTMGQEGTPMKVAYDNSTAIGYGDPVIQLNTGYIGRAASATAVAITGIFVGCRYLASSNNQWTFSKYWPGSGNLGTGDVQAFVLTDPSQTYIAQAFNTSFSFTDVGANVNIQIGTVSTTTGFSGASVDFSTLAVTTTIGFRIVGLLSAYYGTSGAVNGTDDTTAYNRVIVKPNYWANKSLDGI